MRKCVGKQVFSVITLLFAGAVFSFGGPVDFSKDKIVQPVAPVCDPRWYISIGGNGEFNASGTDFQNASVITLPNGFPIGHINSHDLGDAYASAFYSVEGELGYVLSDRIELFGEFRYAASASSNWIHRAGVINAGAPTFIALKFDEYNSYGFQLGARYFFASKTARLRPYVSIAAGASHVDSIDAETGVEPTDFVVSRTHFFDDSWVGTVTGLVGVEYSVSCHLAVGINSGVGYSSPLSEDDSELHGPVAKVNDDAGDRVYCPVAVYAKIRF